MDRNHLKDAEYRLVDAVRILQANTQEHGPVALGLIATSDQFFQWSQSAAQIAQAEQMAAIVERLDKLIALLSRDEPSNGPDWEPWQEEAQK